MNILGLILIYVYTQKICKSLERTIKKEDAELSPIEGIVLGIALLICSIISLIELLLILIILFI